MSNKQYFTDKTGKIIGSVITETNGKKMYLDATGALVARTHDGKTLDKHGAFVGYGDQGMRLLK